MTSAPTVAVWEATGFGQFRQVGQVLAYRRLQVEKRFREPGPWQMELPYDQRALSLLPDRLVSIDWRGQTMAGTVESFNPASDPDTGEPVLTMGGRSTLAVLERCLAWPDPTAGLDSQPYRTPRISGDAESVVRELIRSNYVTRRGDSLALGTNGNRGESIGARPNFDNLLEIVAKKARRGGIGVDVTLERTSDMRAELALNVWTPQDKTRRVRLTQAAGTLRDWQQDSTAPEVTHALVGGAGSGNARVFLQVSTNASEQSAQTWGGIRETFVDGPDSFDEPDLDQAGKEALDDGAETLSINFTAAEAEGLLAFRDYDVGDKATAALLTGVEVQDVITSIGITVDDNGVTVTPGFGSPNRKDPALALGDEIRKIRRGLRHRQTRR